MEARKKNSLLNRLGMYISILLGAFLLSFFAREGYSQSKNNKTQYYVEIIYGDTIQAIKLKDLPIISKKKRNGMSNARYQRLIRAVKLTYPIAQEANRKLKEKPGRQTLF